MKVTAKIRSTKLEEMIKSIFETNTALYIEKEGILELSQLGNSEVLPYLEQIRVEVLEGT